jgi:hypothetical protein
MDRWLDPDPSTPPPAVEAAEGLVGETALLARPHHQLDDLHGHLRLEPLRVSLVEPEEVRDDPPVAASGELVEPLYARSSDAAPTGQRRLPVTAVVDPLALVIDDVRPPDPRPAFERGSQRRGARNRVGVFNDAIVELQTVDGRRRMPPFRFAGCPTPPAVGPVPAAIPIRPRPDHARPQGTVSI